MAKNPKWVGLVFLFAILLVPVIILLNVIKIGSSFQLPKIFGNNNLSVRISVLNLPPGLPFIVFPAEDVNVDITTKHKSEITIYWIDVIPKSNDFDRQHILIKGTVTQQVTPNGNFVIHIPSSYNTQINKYADFDIVIAYKTINHLKFLDSFDGRTHKHTYIETSGLLREKISLSIPITEIISKSTLMNYVYRHIAINIVFLLLYYIFIGPICAIINKDNTIVNYFVSMAIITTIITSLLSARFLSYGVVVFWGGVLFCIPLVITIKIIHNYFAKRLSP